MIIVAGTVTLPAEHHDAMVGAIADLVAPTRTEEGCLEFEFWADLSGRGRFHLFEVWESLDHLAAHFATPHLKDFRNARDRLEAEVALKRYQAEEIPRA
jgi:quinol monooxygenase YgiN